MSKVKNPQDKKELSLDRERRNTYGENEKSSRRNIRRGKQRSHMDERRRSAEALRQIKAIVTDDEATDAELLAKCRIADSRNRGFKKTPDTPLREVLDRRRARKLAASVKG